MRETRLQKSNLGFVKNEPYRYWRCGCKRISNRHNRWCLCINETETGGEQSNRQTRAVWTPRTIICNHTAKPHNTHRPHTRVTFNGQTKHFAVAVPVASARRPTSPYLNTPAHTTLLTLVPGPKPTSRIPWPSQEYCCTPQPTG